MQRHVREMSKARSLGLKCMLACPPTNGRDTPHRELSQTITYLLVSLIRNLATFSLTVLIRVITLK